MATALTRWRQCRAVELVLEGKKYDDIAREVGYANRGTAHRAVAKALSERVVDNIDELRALEGNRLDALQAALWDDAMDGDVRAANTIVKIIALRCRLLGLYAIKRDQHAAASLVLTPTELAAWEREHDEDEPGLATLSGNTGEATRVASNCA